VRPADWGILGGAPAAVGEMRGPGLMRAGRRGPGGGSLGSAAADGEVTGAAAVRDGGGEKAAGEKAADTATER
jgi:hypothetical protein